MSGTQQLLEKAPSRSVVALRPRLLGLARMYEEGLGMEPDLVEAYKLYYIARDRPFMEDDKVRAEAGLLNLKLKMSEDLMDYARKRALKWQPKSPPEEL